MDDSGGFGAPPPPPPPGAGGGGKIPQRGLGDILSVAFDVYKANAAKLIQIVAIVIQQLILGSLTRGAAGALIGRQVDVKGSYEYAFSRLWGLIGLALLIA